MRSHSSAEPFRPYVYEGTASADTPSPPQCQTSAPESCPDERHPLASSCTAPPRYNREAEQTPDSHSGTSTSLDRRSKAERDCGCRAAHTPAPTAATRPHPSPE